MSRTEPSVRLQRRERSVAPKRLSPLRGDFHDWTASRTPQLLTTNFGSTELPFQRWLHFKEAFAPELIHRAAHESPIHVRSCVDPFAGSGTTPLACQFLNIQPLAIEVNPYLADLIKAKLTRYDTDSLADDFAEVLTNAAATGNSNYIFGTLPPTFIEPGVNGRWIFDSAVAERLAAYRSAISRLPNQSHRRFFMALLGGILVAVSNVVVNGKGRRYRRSSKRVNPVAVRNLFSERVRDAITDVHRFRDRPTNGADVRCGDSRDELRLVKNRFDLAVFSPPYPNSFDYTDVYNLELWMLGYLRDTAMNRSLRLQTLSSHVQIGRDFGVLVDAPKQLRQTVESLQRQDLWDRRIPDMVEGYFYDMTIVLRQVHRVLNPGATAWIVVGDSKYGTVHIRTAEILAHIAADSGWKVTSIEPCRSMQASAQQGGQRELAEQLVVLTRA